MKIIQTISTVLAFCIALAIFNGCAVKEPRNPFEPITLLEKEEFDLYQPNGSGPFPAILVVHGGGWEDRSRADMADICRKLAAAGFVAVNASYRFAPKFKFPAQLEDLARIYDDVTAHATDYKIDPKRWGGWGYSAGAQLVSLLATLDHKSKEDRGRKFSAIVSGGGPYDLTQYPDSKLVSQFLGKSLKDARKLYESASPLYQISQDDPPFFLYHGRNDWTVSFEQMRAMKRKLEEKKVDVETYSVPLLGHSAVFLLSGEAVARGIRFLGEYLK